jgi:hypothetical protein
MVDAIVKFYGLTICIQHVSGTPRAHQGSLCLLLMVSSPSSQGFAGEGLLCSKLDHQKKQQHAAKSLM